MTVNNGLAKWRLGAQGIQAFPLLAASSQIETALMAGKSMSPHMERRKQAPIRLMKQWKEKGGTSAFSKI